MYTLDVSLVDQVHAFLRSSLMAAFGTLVSESLDKKFAFLLSWAHLTSEFCLVHEGMCVAKGHILDSLGEGPPRRVCCPLAGHVTQHIRQEGSEHRKK